MSIMKKSISLIGVIQVTDIMMNVLPFYANHNLACFVRNGNALVKYAGS